jgi:hypothetical protein
LKLEDQVCSLGSAKRLRKLGVKQSSLIYWIESDVTGTFLHSPVCGIRPSTNEGNPFSAFTVAELGEMLPQVIVIPTTTVRKKYVLVIGKVFGDQWQVSYRGNQQTFIYFNCYTEAEARAKMLIYLLENKLMDLPNAL